MGKFIESMLWCIGYFFISSILVGSFIFGLFNVAIEAVIPEGTAIRYLLQKIIETAVICAILYITLHRSGHKGNITAFSGKTTVKYMLIPVIISVILFQILFLAQEISFRINLPSASQSRPEIFLSLLPQFVLQSAVYIIIMIFGYKKGYKKFDGERTEMLSVKMD